MNDLGIRELKAKASEILRTVREQGSRYVITHRGRPIAILSPVEAVDQSTIDPDSKKGDHQWQELETLGKQVNAAWQADQSSIEILAAMRR